MMPLYLSIPILVFAIFSLIVVWYIVWRMRKDVQDWFIVGMLGSAPSLGIIGGFMMAYMT